MAGGGWRRSAARVRTLRVLLRDTTRALQHVQDILPHDQETCSKVEDIGALASRPTALVILGTSQSARIRLLHCLLGKRLLPDSLPRGCRWLRVQYGNTTQVHLTLGTSEFELVEDLECNKQPWETLPLQDLLRQNNTDLTTVLEVEINNSFLKDGLRIIMPPDIDEDPGSLNFQTLKDTHGDFYQKRHSILKNYAPIYLYALDRYGKNIFSETINKLSVSRSDEDFWANFDLYSVNTTEKKVETNDGLWKEESSVFNAENLLDFHQIKDIDPNAQVLFVLFSDSELEESRVEFSSECTESCRDGDRSEELPESDRDLLREARNTQESQTDIRVQEEKVAFMNDLLDQWEVMSAPPRKHYVKSQWLILDDTDMLSTDKPAPETARRRKDNRTVKSRTSLLSSVLKFATDCAQSYLLEQCSMLSEIHVKILQRLILASFDLARELQVLPKRIQYVARQEQHLFETINDKFKEGDKKQELVNKMQEVLNEMRSEINCMDWSVDDLPCHQDKEFLISNSIFYATRESPTVSIRLNRLNQSLQRKNNCDTRETRFDYEPNKSSGRNGPEMSRNEMNFDQDGTDGTQNETDLDQNEVGLDQTDSNRESPDSLSDGEEALSYDSFNLDEYDIVPSNEESFGVSQNYWNQQSVGSALGASVGSIRAETDSVASWRSACSTALSAKHAQLDVQRTVLSKLSRKISLKLANFVDCLKDNYFGTLQRCLESLESCCREELGGRPASEAMRALVSAARAVELQPGSTFSVLTSLLDSLRRLFHSVRWAGWSRGAGGAGACCVLSPVWRRRAARHALHSLTAAHLARLISVQILERLSEAHERYQAALASLENALTNRLHHTEDVKLAIRKQFAPSFARLCLESTSMCDLLMYGTPDLGREIGRGQYGVVYAVRGAWAGRAPAAAKSVLPADARHYAELAMEFFYTRSIPPHPRIVRLLGSLVQRSGRGGGGGGDAGVGVILVSERWSRDLHTAVRAGLTFAQRMRVACDIVEGIRYLHALGLVHRDVKLKNVLLDAAGRAALSDLGFCAAGALVSGSLVGTPVHMAPELLAGRYHAAVDVYAFAVLFWYLCAGNIRLPSAFETFQNKEQLWSKVKKGLRPERLPQFSDECWHIMESCWASEPSQRALLGDIQPQLEEILRTAIREDQGHLVYNDVGEDEDSLNMTGLDG